MRRDSLTFPQLLYTYIHTVWVGQKTLGKKDKNEQCVFSNQKPSVTYAENFLFLQFKHINSLIYDGIAGDTENTGV